ncbi:MAG: hypothetical protein JST92_01405 [Deltaproteobacteria bacterium]|nr:hypothetical protein [Deltaproteobacteria bacterium]
MFGLTTLGLIHTVISLIAIGAGIVALLRGGISPRTGAGQLYLLCTILTAATALGIFRHGGFGPPHGLAILTLVVIVAGGVASAKKSYKLEAVAYSTTILFHLIPGVTESLTRLPPGAPIAASPEAPIFHVLYPICLLLTIAIVVIQVRRARG